MWTGLTHTLGSAETWLLYRDRLSLLLAALSLLHQKMHSQRDTQRCQVVEAAISQFASSFKALLLDSTQPSQAPAGQQVSWQQVHI